MPDDIKDESTAQDTTKPDAPSHADILYAEDKKDEAVKDDKVDDDKSDESKADDEKASEGATDDPKDEDKKEDSKEDDKEELIEYDLKLPEGSTLSKEAVEELTEYAQSQKLSPEQAQSLLERENSLHSKFTEQSINQLNTKSEEWVNELRADKDFGGEKYVDNVAAAKKVVDLYADDTLKDALNSTRLGNHPGLLKMLARIGRRTGDAKYIDGKSAPPEKKSHAEILYGGTSA